MIKEIIYDYYKQKESDHKPGDNFAPSYLTDCRRKIYYKKKSIAASNPIPEHGYLKMDFGNAIHEKLQSIFKKMGIWIEGEDFKEIEMFDLKWIYRIDGKLKLNNKVYICEIKSIYAKGFKAIEQEPKEKDLLQLVMYMIFEKVNDGILLYPGRDNGFMIEYIINNLKFIHSDSVSLNINGVTTICPIGDYFGKLKKLKKQMDGNELPDRDFQMVFKKTDNGYSTNFQKDKIKYESSYKCDRYCQWRDLCWQDVIRGLKAFYINEEFLDA